MRALVVTRHGGPEVLQVRQVPDPAPGPGQVLVEVAASGVNFVEVYHRTGAYPTNPPFTLGMEAAGRVVALGEGITAHYLTTSTYPVQNGDWALVHAAAGGMGLLLTQLVTRRGGRVIGTVSTAEKEKLARDNGAEQVIRYTEVDDLATAVREVTGGAGVSVVYDAVGESTFDASLASLRPRGMLALYGAASGQVPPFDLQRLNAAGSLFVTRPTLAHYIAERPELEWRAGEVLGWVADGSLEVRIGHTYPLEEAAEAYRALESRRTTGKLLLTP